MRARFKISVTTGLAVAAAWPLASGAVDQNPFPDGPGRDSVILACSQCHSIGKILQAKLDADDWQFIVYDMIGRGAPLHADDIADVTRYLQDNFATDNN